MTRSAASVGREGTSYLLRLVITVFPGFPAVSGIVGCREPTSAAVCSQAGTPDPRHQVDEMHDCSLSKQETIGWPSPRVVDSESGSKTNVMAPHEGYNF